MRWHVKEYPLPITEKTIPSSSLSWADLLEADVQRDPKRFFTEATHHAFENPESHAFFDGTYANLEDVSARADSQITDAIRMRNLSPRARLSYALVSLAYLSVARFCVTRRVAPPDKEPLVIIQPPTDELATYLQRLWTATEKPRANVRTAVRQLPQIIEAAREERCFLPISPSESNPIDITYAQCIRAIQNGENSIIWQYISSTLASYGKNVE